MAFRHTVAVLSLVGALSACGGISSPSTNKVQDFAGTLPVGGSTSYPFSASKTGEFFVTVTELGNRTLTIGTGLGEVVNSQCQPLAGYVQPFSRWNQQALGGPISKGSYCVVVYDPGTLVAAITYTVRVSHP